MGKINEEFSGYIKIQQIPDFLRKYYGIKLTYRGLRHYIQNKLLPKPYKFKGVKEKYYNGFEIAKYLIWIKFTSSVLNVNTNKIKRMLDVK